MPQEQTTVQFFFLAKASAKSRDFIFMANPVKDRRSYAKAFACKAGTGGRHDDAAHMGSVSAIHRKGKIVTHYSEVAIQTVFTEFFFPMHPVSLLFFKV